MLDIYFQNQVKKSPKNILVINPAGGDLDNIVKFLDLEFIDLSRNYSRGDSVYINYLNAAKYLRKNNIEDCLIVGSDFQGVLDFQFFIKRPSENNFLLLLTTKNSKYCSNNIRIQDTPSNITYKEFQNKLCTHLSKVLGIESFLPSDASFPTKHFKFVNLLEVASCKEDYFSGETTLKEFHLDFIFKRDKSSSKLIILNQAAVVRNRKLPIFQRWKWINDINGNVLILNDPLLYVNDKFKATWWVGTNEVDIVKVFTEEIKKLIKQMQIFPDDVFFYGSSAGGYASLQQAACLEGSTAIIDIAQTNLFSYKQKAEVNLVSQVLFGKTIQEVDKVFHERFNALQRIENQSGKVKVYILQNIEDVHHLLYQTLPLIDKLKELKNNTHKLITYKVLHPNKGGHIPLSRRNTVPLLNKIVSYSNFCINNHYLEFGMLKVEDL